MTAFQRSSVLVVVMAFIAACDGQTGEPSASPPRSGETSPSDGPDVEVQTFSLSGIDVLLERLADVGWTEAMILPGAEPQSLQVWRGDGHWHARTTFRSHGMDVTIIQAEFEGLPPGQLTTIRGHGGVRSDGGLYWIERDFTLALSPGNQQLAGSLGWVELR